MILDITISLLLAQDSNKLVPKEMPSAKIYEYNEPFKVGEEVYYVDILDSIKYGPQIIKCKIIKVAASSQPAFVGPDIQFPESLALQYYISRNTKYYVHINKDTKMFRTRKEALLYSISELKKQNEIINGRISEMEKE